ncbi:MAG: S-layer homology domain-containing protein [Fimbriimonadaceae bacterium]|nr:S-layer homology domain-containing protein [Fimbriimonadaceae bacterium]
MKRTFVYALSAVMAVALAAPASAQDAFPDTPDNHWAYEALARLKNAGLLVGYPDGLFRGGRPASRYEMAVALNALYMKMMGVTDGLAGQIKALEESISHRGFASAAELRQVRDALAAAQSQIDGMKAWGDEIANLKRMAATFEKELASMGVDVEAMKKGFADLEKRVKALEDRKFPIAVSGDLNLWMGNGYSKDERVGITKDGRPTGIKNGNTVGVGRDFTVLHEMGLEIEGTNETGPKWGGTLVIGNTFGTTASFTSAGFNGNNAFDRVAFGDMSGVFTGSPFEEGDTDVMWQTLWVKYDTSLWGQNFSATMGRLGHQVGSYFMKRPDNTPYFRSEYWDNGDWYFDGAILDFKLGNADLTVFGGRQSDRFTTSGIDINPMAAGRSGHSYQGAGDTRPRGYGSNGFNIFVDQHLGFTADLPLGQNGNLQLNYLIFDSNSTTSLIGSSDVFNRVVVFGGDFNWKVNDRMKLNAGYSQSNLMENGTTRLDEDNSAWWAKLKYDGGRWNGYVGYRSIDPQFAAPGDWGRVGIWWNPTDVQGFMAGIGFDLSSSTKVHFGGQWYTGRDVMLADGGGLTQDDKLRVLSASLKHRLSSSWNLMLGAECVEWDLNAFSEKPRESWYRFGLSHDMGNHSKLSFMWEMSDYNGKGVTGFNPFSGSSDSRATGGFLTTQISIRF